MTNNTYVGRFVAAARTNGGKLLIGYRVSSRSFANRKIINSGDTCSVVPIDPSQYADNPYISYNCLRKHGDVLVASNGSHTDPIIEKITLGYPIRDSLALSLLSLDFEKDKYNTPRIACVVDWARESATMAIVMPEKLDIREVDLSPAEAFIIATYEITDPTRIRIQSADAAGFADELYQMKYTHPVCSLAATISKNRLEVAVHNT